MPFMTALKVTNSDFVLWAIISASVVFPTPGGPHNIMEEIWSLSIISLRNFPGPTRCVWPIKSLKSLGRTRLAKGAESSVS